MSTVIAPKKSKRHAPILELVVNRCPREEHYMVHAGKVWRCNRPGCSEVRPFGGVSPGPLPLICKECGNDEVCEGYDLCSECLEEFGV